MPSEKLIYSGVFFSTSTLTAYSDRYSTFNYPFKIPS
jgi:hypothetical protein